MKLRAIYVDLWRPQSLLRNVIFKASRRFVQVIVLQGRYQSRIILGKIVQGFVNVPNLVASFFGKANIFGGKSGKMNPDFSQNQTNSI